MRLHQRSVTRLPGPSRAVVSSDDAALSATGGVSKDIRLAAGSAYEAELKARRTELASRVPRVGDVVVTGAGTLGADRVFHVVTVSGSQRLDETALAEALGRCLHLASSLSLSTIVFPALGAGAAGFSPREAARILVGAVASYFRSGCSSLRTVEFAIPDPAVFAAFDREFTRLLIDTLEPPSGSRRTLEMAVLFSDIVGSTSFFESMGDENGLELLDRHHRLVLPLVSAHRGTVIKRLGDGLLITFADVATAARCARSMLRAVAGYSRDARPGWDIRLRIGIHFGSLIAAGGDVFGDVVNSAQRIQSLAEPDQALLSEAAHDRLSETHAVRPLGARSAKGKSQPLTVFELLPEP